MKAKKKEKATEPTVRQYEEARYYTLPDGTEVPSVTTVLSVIDKSGPLIQWAVKATCDFIDAKTTDGMFLAEALTLARKEATRVKEEAGDIGKLLHDAVEEWAKARIEGKEYFAYFEEERLRNAWDAFLMFAETFELKPITAELKVVHEEMRYGGQVDLVAGIRRPNGTHGIYLIDVKSSKHFLEIPYGPQVAAYAEALQRWPKVDGIAVVRLDKATGLPFFHDLTEKRERYIEVFYDALELWRSLKAVKGVKE